MGFLDQEYVADQMPASQSFEPLPAGWYDADITEASLKDTKAGTGQYIAIKYTILGPTNTGRIIFGNMNIKNPNDKAEEIGRQQLGEIMRAIGLASIKDTDQLIGASLSIKLKVTPTKDGYDAGNDVRAFKALTGSQAPVQAQPQAQPQEQVQGQPQEPAKTGSAPPWQKK